MSRVQRTALLMGGALTLIALTVIVWAELVITSGPAASSLHSAQFVEGTALVAWMAGVAGLCYWGSRS